MEILRKLRFFFCIASVLSGCAYAEQQQFNAPVDPYIGMHMHRADQGTEWPKGAFGSWRLWDAYVGWKDLEPTRGNWNFSRLDRYVGMATLTGVDILLPFGVPPAWASARPSEKGPYGSGTAAEPTNIADWENYVRTVALRYKGRIRHFDVWNEVNEAGFYTGSIKKLVELTCAAQKVLKSVDSSNMLVSPSMVGEGREPELFGEFLAAGAARCVDIVGYHFYVPKGEPEALVPLVARVRAVMKKAGVGALPLWNTEFGWWIENSDGYPESGVSKSWHRVSETELASFIARSLIIGKSLGIERFYWYAWDNYGMGLISPSTGKLKPGAVAFNTVAEWLAQGDIKSCVESNLQWRCDMSAPAGQRRYVAWMTGGRKGKFSVSEGAKILNVQTLGKRNISAESLQGVRTWDLDADPVLISIVMP